MKLVHISDQLKVSVSEQISSVLTIHVALRMPMGLRIDHFYLNLQEQKNGIR